MNEARSEDRKPKAGRYTLTWQDRSGNQYSTEGTGVNVSRSGVGIECAKELKEGAIVHVRAWDRSLDEDCEVIHCTRQGNRFFIGFELREEPKGRTEPPPTQRTTAIDDDLDLYEILQISRKADLETIHRVFRIMATRFHPDNPETGDTEQFIRMRRAYEVLSDRERRTEYDAKLEDVRAAGPRPIFALKDFVTGVEAETNRRFGVLAILYSQRQANPDKAGVSLLDLEKEMGFPREYLSFTTWYLASRDYIAIADNSDFTITAGGVDYLEKTAGQNEIVGKLLYRGGQGAQFSAPGSSARAKNGSNFSPRLPSGANVR